MVLQETRVFGSPIGATIGLVYTTHSRNDVFNAMSDAVIIYLTNFEKGVMRAWISPKASGHSEYIEERKGDRVKS